MSWLSYINVFVMHQFLQVPVHFTDKKKTNFIQVKLNNEANILEHKLLTFTFMLVCKVYLEGHTHNNSFKTCDLVLFMKRKKTEK